jgi:hypothetical protein
MGISAKVTTECLGHRAIAANEVEAALLKKKWTVDG